MHSREKLTVSGCCSALTDMYVDLYQRPSASRYLAVLKNTTSSAGQRHCHPITASTSATDQTGQVKFCSIFSCSDKRVNEPEHVAHDNAHCCYKQSFVTPL